MTPRLGKTHCTLATLPACALVVTAIAACAVSSDSAPTPLSQPHLREVLPGVRCDIAQRTIEFDATVVWDEREAPVALECIVCTPNTKEHESLLVTSIRPSHLHAALLMIDLQPGRPGGYLWQNDALVPRQPEGPAVQVEFVRTINGAATTVDPREWINAQDTTRTLDNASPHDGWLFTGSMLMQSPAGYAADVDGTLIGLAAFGSETIAWASTISTESVMLADTWIADSRTIPPAGTPITVRIRPAPNPQKKTASP